MTQSSESQNCNTTCRYIAVAAGLLLGLVFWAGVGWGFFLSLIVGVVVFVVAAVMLPRFFCSDNDGQEGEVSPPVSPPVSAPKPSAAPAPVAEPTARPEPEPDTEPEPEPEPAASQPAEASSASAIKASASLPGQNELAARKGVWRYQGGADETAAKPAPAAKPAAEVADGGAQPEGLTKARAGGADDLKMIKGVGPKLEMQLNSMGYFHFDQISGWGATDVAWVDQNLKGFKGRVSRDNWVEQAKSLAAGEETEFAKRAKKDGTYD